MGDDGIYRKTEKGHAEVATRANKLGLRERAMLIVVDDKTTRGDLLSKSSYPGAAAILDALLAQGFIEIGPGAAAGAAAIATANRASVAATTQAVGAIEVSEISASRFACRALVTYLGPSADDLALMVEDCGGTAELTAALQKCRQIIQELRGKQKADEFWAGVIARMPGL